MAQLVLSDVDEAVLARLEARAARHRTSVEEEARRALAESVSQDFAAIIARFDAFVAALPPEPEAGGR
jgi:plasmid stability protein